MRDYKVERWYRRQPVHDYDPEMEYNIEENSKLKFCQDVLRLQSQLKPPTMSPNASASPTVSLPISPKLGCRRLLVPLALRHFGHVLRRL